MFKMRRKTDEELTGLGGWLVLLGLGILGSAGKNAYELIATYGPLFTSSRWAEMTTPGAAGYAPDLAGFVCFEVTALAVLLALNGGVIYLFLARKRLFPKAFIVFLLASLGFSVADLAAFHWLVPGREVFDPQSLATLVGGVFSLVVWGAYIWRSRRVHLTFVR